MIDHERLLVLICVIAISWQTASLQTTGQPPSAGDRNQSERSDTLTGGRIELTELAPNEPDIRITLNLPSFRLVETESIAEGRAMAEGKVLPLIPRKGKR